MNCSEVQERLSAFHDSELPSDEAAQVAAHLADCRSCAAEIASFERLSGLSRRLTDPPVPSNLWPELSAKLEAGAGSTTILARVLPSRLLGRVLALAATVLIALGIGVVSFRTLTSNRMDHLGMDFAHYLDDFEASPENAQQILLAKYDGRPTAIENAINVLGYEPAATKGLPADYSLEEVYLIDMPCCTCAQVVCKNKDGRSIAIFEHDTGQPVGFGDRPSTECLCSNVPTSVMQVGDRLAATWKEGTRYITVVGATDLDEVTKFVAHFRRSDSSSG